jgi:hypothetical protein
LGRRFLVAAIWVAILILAITIPLFWAFSRGHFVVFPAGEDRIALLGVFLAAATLVLTGVALLIAIAAVVGYSSLRDAAINSARTIAEKVAMEHLQALRTRQAFDEMYRSADEPADDALARALEQPDQEQH